MSPAPPEATGSIYDRIVFDERGLVPVVVQQVDTREVLMVAWMNRESVELTLTTGTATFWSRSRQELWVKGATSGNIQRVVSMSADCDFDTLLLTVDQTGNACHTGNHSCFDAFTTHPEREQVGETS